MIKPFILSLLITVAGLGIMQVDQICKQLDYPAHTTAEIELIERVVAAEARGESLEGQMAVAQVILDRSELWGMSVTEVIYQPSQFADPYMGPISERTQEAVSRVLQGERIFEERVTHFAENVPYWAADKALIGQVGVHKFWY